MDEPLSTDEGKYMKILLCALVKDDSEYAQFQRMLESFMPYVQGLVVLGNGVSQEFEKVKHIVELYNGKFVSISPKTNPECYGELDGKFYPHFANLRNRLFDEADKLDGYDWYIWADKDDVLVGGHNLRLIAENSLKIHADMVFFTYWYSIKVQKDGTYTDKDVEIDQIRERLLRPKYFKWVSRLHEIALPKEESYKPKMSDWPYNPERKDNVVWVHLHEKEDVKKAVERNIGVLTLQVKDEKGKDPRTLFYLAKTYYDAERDKEAIELLEKYLEMSGWQEERASAWEYLSKIYGRGGDHLKAIECLHSGIKEYPDRHLNYLNLSREYMAIGRWDNANFWCDVAIHMDPPKARTTIGNPFEIMFMASGLKANIAKEKLDIDGCIYWLKKQNDLTKDGTNDDLIEKMEDLKYYNQIGLTIFNLAKYLKTKGYTERVKKLVEIIPPEYGQEPMVYKIANEVMEPRKWGEKSIVYYASFGGKFFEEWNAESLKSGIGGSETAVIQLAKRWQKLGYEVTVFCDCGDKQGVYEGVIYRPYWEMNFNDEFNILILWRSPHLLELDLHAKKLFMDLHDICSNLDWPKEKVDKIDKVFFKSKYQRKMLPTVPDSKAVIISNGI
jgi:tetratricopeptide (TPR) repeat protein